MKLNTRILQALVLPLILSACSMTSPLRHTADASSAAPVPQEAQARFDNGLRAMEEEEWYRALPDMEIIWEKYPQYSGPALNAALIHQRENRSEEAENWFLRALEANGQNLDARNAYGIFLREQGRYSEAQEQYLAALAVSEEHAATHYNMGILCDLYLGEKGKALDHFSRYQELSDEQTRQVAGWIADLQRQMVKANLAQGGAS